MSKMQDNTLFLTENIQAAGVCKICHKPFGVERECMKAHLLSTDPRNWEEFKSDSKYE